MIDPATGWFEVAILKHGANGFGAQRLLDSQWLAQFLQDQRKLASMEVVNLKLIS